MVTLLKRFMILSSLILTVGSAVTMQQPGQQPLLIQQGQQPVQRVAQPVNGAQLSSLPREVLEKALLDNKQAQEERDKKAASEEDEEVVEQEQSGLSRTFSVVRAVAVALGSAWRIQHFASQFYTKNGSADFTSGLQFNLGCLAAAGTIALLDYCMPGKMGGFLLGAFGMDALYSNGYISAPLAEVAVTATTTVVKKVVETAS